MIEIKLRSDTGRDPFNWCCENFGFPEPNGTRWAWDTGRIYWFHDQADAALFKLRWL